MAWSRKHYEWYHGGDPELDAELSVEKKATRCDSCRHNGDTDCTRKCKKDIDEANIEAIKDFAEYVDLQPGFGVYDYFGNIVTVVDLVEDYTKVKGIEK